MTMWKQVRRGGLIALAISVVAVMAFASGHVNPNSAQAQGPAITLDAPGTVFMGVTFLVTVNADPAPDVEIISFGSEVLFPDGLKWQPRATCADEVMPQTEAGGPPALCQAGLSTLLGGARHAVISAIGIPPIAPFDVVPGSTTTLLELDFVCNTLGSYTLTLTATPDSPDGAVFGDTFAVEIPVKTVEGTYDADGDGTVETHQVADTLTLECTDEPPPTDVPPTDVPVPTDMPEPTATVEATVGGPVTGVAGSTGDSGTNAGIWVLIGALLAASLAGMTVFGWKRIRVR